MIDAVTRTPEEIVARITEVAPRDFFGAESTRLLRALPWEHAAPLLTDDARQSYEKGEQTWEVKTHPRQAILNYLPFAMNKADSHRGLSANRSIDHMRGLTWLLGCYDKVEWDNFENYGAPVLKQIAGMLSPEGATLWAELATPGLERMAMGEPCEDGCSEGCGT